MKPSSLQFRATLFAALVLNGAGALADTKAYVDVRAIGPVGGNAKAGEEKAVTCLACHGADGTSSGPEVPRLAGQRPAYLYYRLVSFKKGGKYDPNDPYFAQSPMTGIVAGLELKDRDLRDLAAYFSSLGAQSTDNDEATATAAKGEALFHHGDPSRGIPPCQACHGPDARGLTTRADQYAAYPVLRGQKAQYIAYRLKNYRNGEPHNISNNFIMGGVAMVLDDDAIDSIAAWLSSLPWQGSN